jgi:hypothetical protein
MAKKKENKNRGTRKSSLDSYLPGLNVSYRRLIPALVIVAAVLLIVAGLGSAANKPPALTPTKPPRPTVTVTAPPTASLDPCAPEVIRPDVEKVDAVMQEFYDASALASQTPADKLLEVIPTLQEIRRRAEALKVSSCLDKLRSFQISHMNMVINTMLAFMGNADQGTLVEGVVQARLLNEEYKKERARLLGETYVPPVTVTPQPTPGTGTPQVTPTA